MLACIFGHTLLRFTRKTIIISKHIHKGMTLSCAVEYDLQLTLQSRLWLTVTIRVRV